jgi:hypothetical protein
VRALFREAAASGPPPAGVLDEEVTNTSTGEVLTLRAWLTQLALDMEADAGAPPAATDTVIDAELPEEATT